MTRSINAVANNDIKAARKNWKEWKDVFEHRGDPRDNPLLKDSCRFDKFLSSYSVGRTIRKGMRDNLRKALCDTNLRSLLRDQSGKKLDNLECKLHRKFGTHRPRRKMISVMSKIAAFLAPHAFIAYDQFSRKGLNKLLERPKSRNFVCYADFLMEVNGILHGEIGRHIRKACVGKYPSKQTSLNNRFHRRVLDAYLMRLGDRSF